MNVTITAHQAASIGDPDLHCFTFRVDDAGSARMGTVTVRTARIFARELANLTGLDAMMRAIVAAQPSEYDALIGACYHDA